MRRKLELVVQSLGELGGVFGAARGTAADEVRRLLARLPGRERFRAKRHIEAGRRLGLVEALDECERLESERGDRSGLLRELVARLGRRAGEPAP